MKLYLLLFSGIVLTGLALLNARSQKPVTDYDRRVNEKLEKVTILYVPLATKTATVVSCDQLQTVFRKKLKVLEITDQKRLKKIATLFLNAVSAKDRYLNVRVKFILKYAEHTETYCMDREGTLEGYEFRWGPEIAKWFRQEIEK